MGGSRYYMWIKFLTLKSHNNTADSIYFGRRDMNDLKLRRYIISYLRKLSIENEWMLIVVCHPLPPTQRFLETQFWRHAITSEGVVTIAPSVLRALRVNSGRK